MAGRYAVDTAVTVEKSKAEIETILRRYGATTFASGWDQERSVIQFEAHGRRLRFVLPMPDPNDPEFTTYRRGQSGTLSKRTPEVAAKMWEQACRSSWRSLALVIKAMLEAVEAEIVVFEDIFAPFIVLPNGQSVADWIRPSVEKAYATGSMPPMLSLGSGQVS